MNTTEEKKTTEAKKTTKDLLFDAVNCLGGAVWDLRIVENTLATSVENGQIVIPDIDNDPLRLALLALHSIRHTLEGQEDALWLQMQDEEEKEKQAAAS